MSSEQMEKCSDDYLLIKDFNSRELEMLSGVKAFLKTESNRYMLKVVFISNYFNHHQKAFSEELYQRADIEYFFIETTTMREERRRLGYNIEEVPKYVLRTYLNKYEKKRAFSLIEEADIVIAGSIPEKILLKRARTGKIIFRYSERPIKHNPSWWGFIKLWMKWHIKIPNNKPIYLLSASGYAYSDFKKMGLFKNKAYKWGYFPETKYYCDIRKIINAKKKNLIVWCGRFLDWKRPEYVIEVAKRLKFDNMDFEIRMIGTGEKEASLKKLVEKYELENRVIFTGSMSTEQVRLQMEQAAIYLFTSNRQEGWGAVLNEAMNSACAVIASDSIGSVPYLIDDNNGIKFQADDIDDLYIKVKMLLENQNLQEQLGLEAYYTIIKTWNARVSAERLVNLMNCILNKKNCINMYKDGPCSRADMDY